MRYGSGARAQAKPPRIAKDVIWKGLLGGLVTAAIVLASKRDNVLPGILPLARTFGLIALLAVGSKGDAAGFKEACLAGAKTIPAYLAFLGAAWMLADRVYTGSRS